MVVVSLAFMEHVSLANVHVCARLPHRFAAFWGRDSQSQAGRHPHIALAFPGVGLHSRAMSRPSGSAAEEPGSGKKRKVSARQGAQCLETFMGFTQQGDMKYVMEQLQKEPRLVPFLASWLRDGTLMSALKKHEVKQNKDWPTTCTHLKTTGVKYLRSLLCRWEPEVFYEPEVSEGAGKLDVAACMRLLTFCLGLSADSYVAHKNIDHTTELYDARYKDRGNMLNNIQWDNDWQTMGYYGFVEGSRGKVAVVAGLGKGKDVDLPFSEAVVASLTDLKFHRNWLTTATLESEAAGHTFHLRKLFLLKYPQSDVDTWLPLEQASMTENGESPHESLGITSSATKKKPKPSQNGGKAKGEGKGLIKAARAGMTSAEPVPLPPPPEGGNPAVIAAPPVR